MCECVCVFEEGVRHGGRYLKPTAFLTPLAATKEVAYPDKAQQEPRVTPD